MKEEHLLSLRVSGQKFRKVIMCSNIRSQKTCKRQENKTVENAYISGNVVRSADISLKIRRVNSYANERDDQPVTNKQR
jgi:hypothetical protein